MLAQAERFFGAERPVAVGCIGVGYFPPPNNDPHDALAHIAFTVPYNLSEQPAASINWTASRDGLPIGVQIIGRRFEDAGVLRVARRLEQLRPSAPGLNRPESRVIGGLTRRVTRTAHTSCKNSLWTRRSVLAIVTGRCPGSIGAWSGCEAGRSIRPRRRKRN